MGDDTKTPRYGVPRYVGPGKDNRDNLTDVVSLPPHSPTRSDTISSKPPPHPSSLPRFGETTIAGTALGMTYPALGWVRGIDWNRVIHGIADAEERLCEEIAHNRKLEKAFANTVSDADRERFREKNIKLALEILGFRADCETLEKYKPGSGRR